MTTCTYNPFSVDTFSRLLWLQIVYNEGFGDYFYICLKLLWEISVSSKMEHEWLHILVSILFVLEIFPTSTFIASWYYKVFWSSLIEIIMSLSSSSIFFAYEVTYASAFAYSDYFSLYSCNKSGFFFLPESYC